MSQAHLSDTSLLDFNAPPLRRFVDEKGWRDLLPKARIGAVYDFVRNDTLYGYNEGDALTASRVRADGYGQRTAKGTLFMALLRSIGVPCRFHSFTIDKGLQRGVVPDPVYPISPRDILHSWIEVFFADRWVDPEGFIPEAHVLNTLRIRFPDRNTLRAYGAGTDSLPRPRVEWAGCSTHIQKTGVNRDLGVPDAPAAFYAAQRQLSGFRVWLYRRIVRRWMNRRVAAKRKGAVPSIPGGDGSLLQADSTPRSLIKEAA